MNAQDFIETYIDTDIKTAMLHAGTCRYFLTYDDSTRVVAERYIRLDMWNLRNGTTRRMTNPKQIEDMLKAAKGYELHSCTNVECGVEPSRDSTTDEDAITKARRIAATMPTTLDQARAHTEILQGIMNDRVNELLSQEAGIDPHTDRTCLWLERQIQEKDNDYNFLADQAEKEVA